MKICVLLVGLIFAETVKVTEQTQYNEDRNIHIGRGYLVDDLEYWTIIEFESNEWFLENNQIYVHRQDGKWRCIGLKKSN